MSLQLILLITGVIVFALSLVLFRARRADTDAGVGSIWKGGSAKARIALVLWWVSLGLLVASFVLRLTDV